MLWCFISYHTKCYHKGGSNSSTVLSLPSSSFKFCSKRRRKRRSRRLRDVEVTWRATDYQRWHCPIKHGFDKFLLRAIDARVWLWLVWILDILVLFVVSSSIIMVGCGQSVGGMTCLYPRWPDFLRNNSSKLITISASSLALSFTICFCVGVILPHKTT